MKRITIILFSFCAFTFIVKASYPQTLPIDYSQFFNATAMGADSLVKATYTNTSAAILANQWNNLVLGTSLVENSALSYSTYCDNNFGKSVVVSGNRRYGSYSLTNGSEYTGKPFYLSALINFSAIRNNDAFLFFSRDVYGNYLRWRVTTLTNGTTGFNLGVQQNTETAVTNVTPTLLKFGETYLIVLKVTPALSGTESFSLYINPVIGGAEPTTPEATLSLAFALSKIQAITLRATPTGKIAGLRFSDNWADAVKVGLPKITTPTVGSATLITETSFTANWIPVANAIGYIVKLYQGTSLVSSTTVTGQSTSSLVISGLTGSMIYTYKIVAKGDGIVNDDSNLSASSANITTLAPISVSYIKTDFGDGTWGTAATSYLTYGTYPTAIINGFNIIKGYLYKSTATCPTGEIHTNRFIIGGSSEAALVEFPLLETVGEIEIHAATGTTGSSFRLEELVGSVWQIIGTYITRNTPDSVYTIPLLRSSATKLRIANNTGSSLSIYKIFTRTLQQSSEVTLRSSSPVEGELAYSNIQKTITLTFNRNIQTATGTILLNAVSIQLGSCTILANVVTIPVAMIPSNTINATQTLTVSAGAFAEIGNATNLSKAITLNFQTMKIVGYPSNYSALLDVNYKTVNSTNCRMDIYYPTNATTPAPIIMGIHGGAWVGGFKEGASAFGSYFAKGYAIARIEYRMTGEALAPAAVEDVRGALLYVLNHAQTLNIDKNKIILQGTSAGAHLALMAAYLQNNKMFDNDCPPYNGDIKVLAVTARSAPCDMVNLMYYGGWVNWLGTYTTNMDFVRTVSPITYVTASSPATYLVHGDADASIYYSQSVALAAALETAGAKYKFTTIPGYGHNGFGPYETQVTTETDAFIEEALANATDVKEILIGTNAGIKINGNNINIETSEKTETKVFDCMGRLIISTQNKSFNIPQNGLYIVKVKSTRQDAVFKVLTK